MHDSILLDIKKLLGIHELDDNFDTDLIIHINTAFMILTQLGVGPKQGFKLDNKFQLWEEFDTNETLIEGIKSYIGLKVKSMFDPPSNSFTLEALNNQAKELEWRMFVMTDPPVETFDEDEEEE